MVAFTKIKIANFPAKILNGRFFPQKFKFNSTLSHSYSNITQLVKLTFPPCQVVAFTSLQNG
jgi:hypothetical protein